MIAGYALFLSQIDDRVAEHGPRFIILFLVANY